MMKAVTLLLLLPLLSEILPTETSDDTTSESDSGGLPPGGLPPGDVIFGLPRDGITFRLPPDDFRSKPDPDDYTPFVLDPELTRVPTIGEQMNPSVHPCEDFHEYACGNYKNVKTVSFDHAARLSMSDIHERNQEKMKAILKMPIARSDEKSSERKLKEYFAACVDIGSHDTLREKVILETVVPALGGWNVLGTWKEYEWDFNEALRNAYGEFSSNVVHSISVEGGIKLSYSGRERFRLRTDSGDQVDELYRAYIRMVANNLIDDTNMYFEPYEKSVKVKEFVEDVVSLDLELSRLTHQDTRVKMTLNDLNNETLYVIDWVSFFGYVFKGLQVNESTIVTVQSPFSFRELSSAIARLPVENRKRMLHHYIVWSVVEAYLQEMSKDYSHAKRDFERETAADSTNSAFKLYDHCFVKTKSQLTNAMAAEYLIQHFNDSDRNKVLNLTNTLKDVLMDQLDRSSIMDKTTANRARNKLDALTFIAGHTDWLGNQELVDSYYKDLHVDVQNHLENEISLRKFIKIRQTKHLMGVKQERGLNVDDCVLHGNLGQNEIYAPAGVLQDFVYDEKLPLHKIFGALGGNLGRLFHQVIDTPGRHHDTNGDRNEHTWWTNDSTTNYQMSQSCLSRHYQNASHETFPSEYNYNYLAYLHAPEAMAFINGIRLALNAYRKLVPEQNRTEEVLPGQHFTDVQVLFLSFAQTFCYVRNREWHDITALTVGNDFLEEDLRLNLGLSQLTEFSEAFKCPSSAKMNAQNKCDLL